MQSEWADRYGRVLRQAAVALSATRPAELLVADFRATTQVKDLTEAPNCDGLGRIRHFRRGTGAGWPQNPLPIDPASAFLQTTPGAELRAQVFQNAACNWRCWYCFVPFHLLDAGEKDTRWVTADEAR